VATWITIAVGMVVGLVYRRFAAAHPFGALTDMMLGVTGAFAVRWLVDVLRQIGVSSEPYSWVFLLCGAALLPWSFRFHRRQSQRHRSTHASVLPQDWPPCRKTASSQPDSSKTRAPAA